MSNSPGVISEAMSAKGKSSALIGENSAQIPIRSRMPIGKILERFIIGISCRKPSTFTCLNQDLQDFRICRMMCFLSTHPTKVAVCKKHESNAYIDVSKLNYFSTSTNKKIAKDD